ncbi:MAG: phosphoglucosamine mutase [Clostridia bacterium]|nr:phosphoglucosamine mutase [Clostridia bacterium]
MGRLFGTDGARGVANSELTIELAMNIGRAAAMVLTENSDRKHTKILIGKDTRLSSDMLEGALIAGLCSVGADVVLLGVVPTPTVAFLVKKYNADAGIMISASHNPFEFNGIKIFAGTGYKLPDALEEKIEAIVLDQEKPYYSPTGEGLGRVTRAETAIEEYIDHIIKTVPYRLDGMRIGIDCSNGSSSVSAETLFTRLGAECHILADKPDGININDNCGSTHMENLQKFVVENKLDVGVAFDGDADRCLAVDENGEIVDGDFIMAICALDLASRNKLSRKAAVGTVMSNMGFQRFCSDNGLKFAATNVGDRYVLETMLNEGYNFGGEQSGHVIFLDYATTGDGQLTAAQLLSIVNRRHARLSDIATLMTRFPQVLINVKVTAEGKKNFGENKEISEKIEQVRKELGNDGRILVRMSGTEPLVRVMLEGLDKELINRLAQETADLIKAKIGV